MTTDHPGNHIMEEVLKTKTATKTHEFTLGLSAVARRRRTTREMDTDTRRTAIQVVAVAGNP